MLTNASGEPTATFSYTPYGQPAGSTGTQSTPLGYAGQLTNEQSGLLYMRARIYDPVTGQFLTRDPMEARTEQPYIYANDNPLNATDPTGRFSFSDVTHAIGSTISDAPSAIGHAAEYLNPLKYYEEEIESAENGCSYWRSVLHGLEGAGVLTLDVCAQAGQPPRRYRFEMGLLDFVANAILEWLLYHAIRWVEDHKLLTGFIVVFSGGALLLLLR